MNKLIIATEPSTVTAYAGRLREGDVICLPCGSHPPNRLKKAVADARANFPENKVYAAAGLRRLKDAGNLEVDLVLVDWEKSTVESVGKVWDWDFAYTLREHPKTVLPLRDRYGMVVSGSPLLSRNLLRQGVHWDFPTFNEMGASFTVVMMQGYVKVSPFRHLLDRYLGNAKFEVALDKLVRQFGHGGAGLDRIGVQVSVGDRQAAGVEPERAAAAVRVAAEYGIGTVFLSGQDVKSNLEVLKLLRG